MADKLELYEYDQTWIQVVGDRSLVAELGEYFTYEVPNARFMPSYKNRMWDGRIRLLDYQTQKIYRGLIPYIKIFCKERGYELDVESTLEPICLHDPSTFKIDDFIKSLGLIHTPFDYQKAAFEHAISDHRATFLSPTNSGKSLIIYMMLRYYLEFTNKKILVCVPTIDLVDQLTQEFIDYAPTFDFKKHCHMIYSGQEKDPKGKRVLVSTWQSIYKQQKKYFEDFETIVIDEAHLAQADSLKGILQKSANCFARFGLTGTLDGLEYNRLIIEGLTGPVVKVASNKELIDRKISSDLTIRCLILKYSDAIRNLNKTLTYQQEQAFIVRHEPRNKLIAKLCQAVGPEKNVLVLTAYKEHIKLLKQQCEKTGKKVYVVTGDTPPDERSFIRKIAEVENGIIIIATYGVYSTGINIKNLQVMIMATGYKSLIKVLQSIGRGLRRDGKGNSVSVIDIVDEFGYVTKKGEKRRNYIVKHFFERVKIYVQEQFKYKIDNINIQ